MPLPDGVNQQSIADRLGLSRATVSRCFTNHRAINPTTRARVFELAAHLGYHYLDLRTAATRRTNKPAITFGVLISYAGGFTETDRLESPAPELLDGISQVAQLRQVQLDINYVTQEELTLEGPSYEKIRGLRRSTWAGALLIYPFPDTIVDALLARLPCVSLLEQYGRAEMNCVDVDHSRGIAQVMDLLTEAGHRRIGFFSPRMRPESFWTRHRFSAYLEKLLTLELDFRPEDVINVLPGTALTDEAALAQMEALTAAGVTAWVCATDYAAYAVLAHLEASGWKVPEEVSVTGFDGIEPPEGLPAVATLQAPFRQIGMTGCRRLLDLENAPFDPPQHILLSCLLRPGKTVAAVSEKVAQTSAEPIGRMRR